MLQELQNKKVFLSFDGFENELRQELERNSCAIIEQKDRLFFTNETSLQPIWAQNIWQNPQWIEFASISDAVKKLKALGALWALHSTHLHRRAGLIQEQLMRRSPKPLSFLGPLPQTNFGAWTLWNDKNLLASPVTNSVLPLGGVHFVENKTPPSRAYLKLWEVFTVYGYKPLPGQTVIDLGSSPGGWTWVLSEVGASVISVDKAPLDEDVLKNKNIKMLKKDAFQLKPKDVGPVSILFSDIICEPRRLYDLVYEWRESGLCKNFICTIKFKGETDFAMMDKFLAIPSSRIIHLYNNKHEVTWIAGFTD